jgi:hypothetical protein
MTALADIDVIVLCGGLGTRATYLPRGTPKFLAPFGPTRQCNRGKVFADQFVAELEQRGIRRMVLACAHLAAPIVAWAGEYRSPVDLICSVEPEPAGLVPALRRARAAIGSDPVLLLNGDTLWDVDLSIPLSRWPTADLRQVYSNLGGEPRHAGADFVSLTCLHRLTAEGEPESLAERMLAVERRWCYFSGRGFWDIGDEAGWLAAKRARGIQ